MFIDANLENGRDLYLGGRLTIPVGVRTDVYLKAGYSNLENTLDLTFDDGTELFSERIVAEEDGVRVGAGLNYSLGRKAYIGSEYRYTSYDSDLDKHQIVATLGLRF